MKLKTKKQYAYIIIFISLLVISGISFYLFNNVKSDKAEVTVDQTDTSAQRLLEQTKQQPKDSKSTKQVLFKSGDTVHQASGAASILETENGAVINFGADFKVVDGPDVFVYLSPNPVGQELGKFASLGKLQKANGEQSYVLPDDYKNYKSVVIWCRAFNTTFATAEL